MPDLLDSLIEAKQDLNELEVQKQSLEGQIEAKRQELKTVMLEAESSARLITQQAHQEAKTFRQQAEGFLTEATQKLAEVMARENAVEWVKAEDLRLKAIAEELKLQQSQATLTVSNATAAQELYAGKLKELKAWEDALVAREQALTPSTLPVAEPEPVVKKSKKTA